MAEQRGPTGFGAFSGDGTGDGQGVGDGSGRGYGQPGGRYASHATRGDPGGRRSPRDIDPGAPAHGGARDAAESWRDAVPYGDGRPDYSARPHRLHHVEASLGDYRRGARNQDFPDSGFAQRNYLSQDGEGSAIGRSTIASGAPGPHRGRGPRGYVRSDERIGEDVNDRLAEDPYLDASNIEVQVAAGEVTLTGTVDDRTAKRRAEDDAEGVSGVKHVQNNLRIGDFGAQQASTPPRGIF